MSVEKSDLDRLMDLIQQHVDYTKGLMMTPEDVEDMRFFNSFNPEEELEKHKEQQKTTENKPMIVCILGPVIGDGDATVD